MLSGKFAPSWVVCKSCGLALVSGTLQSGPVSAKTTRGLAVARDAVVLDAVCEPPSSIVFAEATTKTGPNRPLGTPADLKGLAALLLGLGNWSSASVGGLCSALFARRGTEMSASWFHDGAARA